MKLNYKELKKRNYQSGTIHPTGVSIRVYLLGRDTVKSKATFGLPGRNNSRYNHARAGPALWLDSSTRGKYTWNTRVRSNVCGLPGRSNSRPPMSRSCSLARFIQQGYVYMGHKSESEATFGLPARNNSRSLQPLRKQVLLSGSIHPTGVCIHGA